MTSAKPEWRQVPNFPGLQWAPTHDQDVRLVRDMRDPDSEKLVTGPGEFIAWVAEHSKTDGFLPVGDWIKTVTERLGIKQCEPCAARRAAFNRLFPWFRKS